MQESKIKKSLHALVETMDDKHANELYHLAKKLIFEEASKEDRIISKILQEDREVLSKLAK
jgi:hypothetical protein